MNWIVPRGTLAERIRAGAFYIPTDIEKVVSRNLVYRGTQRQFNPIMVMAAKRTIAKGGEVRAIPPAIWIRSFWIRWKMRLSKKVIAMRAAKEIFDDA